LSTPALGKYHTLPLDLTEADGAFHELQIVYPGDIVSHDFGERVVHPAGRKGPPIIWEIRLVNPTRLDMVIEAAPHSITQFFPTKDLTGEVIPANGETSIRIQYYPALGAQNGNVVIRFGNPETRPVRLELRATSKRHSALLPEMHQQDKKNTKEVAATVGLIVGSLLAGFLASTAF